MYTFSIAQNNNAQDAYFDWWLKNTYELYDGYSHNSSSYIELFFTETLPTQDKNDVIAFYGSLTTEDVIENKHCRIYDHLAPWVEFDTEKTMPPCHVDYRTATMSRLNPLITNAYKGEVREIIYYESIIQNQDGTLTGVTPVIKEEYTYYRDVAKMVIYRVLKIWWYLKDDTVFSTHKERLKYYTPNDKIVEGQRLRRNIIDFCQPNVLGMIMATEQVDYDTAVTLGAQLSNKYSSEMSSWITSSRGNPLIQIVTDDTEISWLDNVIDSEGTTIRGYIIDQLNY